MRSLPGTRATLSKSPGSVSFLTTWALFGLVEAIAAPLLLVIALRQHCGNRLGPVIGQRHRPAVVSGVFLAMIDAQRLEDRGEELRHLDAPLGNVLAVLVGLAVNHAALDAAAGQRRTHPREVVAAAQVVDLWRAAHLREGDDQRVF